MAKRELSRRSFLQLCTGATVGTLLAACGPKAPQESPEPGAEATQVPGVEAPTPAPKGKVEIVYYDRTTSAPAWADAYNESQDSVQVNVEIQPPNTRYEQLVAAITAGNAPDVIGVDITSVGRFVELQAVVALDDLVAKETLDSFFQNLVTQPGHYGHYAGHLYGLPFWVDNSMLFYNSAFLEEAGGDPETGIRTWDDYITYGQAVTNEERVGFSMSAANCRFLYHPWIWAQGGDWANADFTEATINSPECIKTFQFVRDMVTVHKVTNDAAGTDWDAMMSLFTGQKAMIVHQGGGAIGLIRQEFPELWEVLGVCPIPGPEEGQKSSFIGGNVASVSTQSKHMEESIDFAIWATASEAGMGVTGEIGYLPGCPAGLDLPVYQKDKKFYDPFKEALEFGYPSRNDPRMNEMRAPMQDAFTWAAQTDKSIEEIADQTNKTMNSIFQR